MDVSIVTKNDLQIFKKELLQDLFIELKKEELRLEKKWLKTKDVRQILQCSAAIVQHLRISGILPYRKIGGTIYYCSEEVQKIFTERKKM